LNQRFLKIIYILWYNIKVVRDALGESERTAMENIYVKMKDRCEEDRPYEKCVKYGTAVLTDAELLAILLRTGTREKDVLTLSRELLNGPRARQGLSSILHYSMDELTGIKGIGQVKAVQILALKELVDRIWKSSISNGRTEFSNTEICASYYTQELRHLEKEEVKIAYLDNRYRLITDCVMTRGTSDMSLVSVRDILESALKCHAECILMLHNHPYGSELPSDADHNVTKLVQEGCKAIGIRLLDHIIIGEHSYYSFRERGFLD